VVVTPNGDGGYTLVFGSRRYKAHEQLGRETIYSRVLNVAPQKAAMLSLTENVDREDVHPVELARKLKSAMARFGYTEQQVAEEIGLSQASISTLVGILDLGDDVLDQIGTLPESPFKRTHAEILVPLIRSTRANRQLEVQQLLCKTIRHQLRSRELKALVRLLKTGSFDRLPARLRESLLQDKAMTVEMVMLFLEPEKIVVGSGRDADCQRRVAQRWDKGELTKLLQKAAKENWPVEKARKQLLEMILRVARQLQTESDTPSSSWQELRKQVSAFRSQLAVCADDIAGEIELDSWQLASLCSDLTWVSAQLNEFLSCAKATLEASRHSPNLGRQLGGQGQ
jgi:ParB family chromosome partitioning protein